MKLTLDNLDQHHVERRHSSWKAIANKTCIKCERKLRVQGLAPRKVVETIPSECQKTSFCNVGCKLFSSLISLLRKES